MPRPVVPIAFLPRAVSRTAAGLKGPGPRRSKVSAMPLALRLSVPRLLKLSAVVLLACLLLVWGLLPWKTTLPLGLCLRAKGRHQPHVLSAYTGQASTHQHTS